MATPIFSVEFGQPLFSFGQATVGHISSRFLTPSLSSSPSGFSLLCFGTIVIVTLGFEIVVPVLGSEIFVSINHVHGGSCEPSKVSPFPVIVCQSSFFAVQL